MSLHPVRAGTLLDQLGRGKGCKYPVLGVPSAPRDATQLEEGMRED